MQALMQKSTGVKRKTLVRDTLFEREYSLDELKRLTTTFRYAREYFLDKKM